MKNLMDAVHALRRPATLVRAARAGLGEYDRQRDLKRLLRLPHAPAPQSALRLLLEEEARLNTIRRERAEWYDFIRHLEVTIALMGEYALLAQAAQATRLAAE
ncbi:hypothetical protein LV82_01298 [Albidovulum inexpectatum]|uniref:Uncharacterized protein n=1 Tax=Albidovulum inexpectatum TaxID=196587 RepID=A0A2S5JIH9_9RHOB|nr:DUF6477 family protein [Albidovulum inexpectatum]PPB81252.1 hypothetical protein LV82_01298 [Albidovulum inexpectatum]